MATKKITIAFNGLPTYGEAFSYRLSLNGNYINYTNGQNYLILNWVSSVNNPLYDVQLKSTLTDTIDNLLLFMQTNWQHPNISYTRVNDTIEVTINIDFVVVANINTSNIYTLLTVSDITTGTTPLLKYFLKWKDTENVDYEARIYQKGYTGTTTEINGYAVLKYGSAKDNLDPIRGNGLDLNLEADTSITLEDLYTESENQFIVKFYRNNVLLFDGFLKPDGIYQSFVMDRWILNVSCVDGLGILKDLAFVQSTGFHFNGKMKCIDIIYNCLKRTGVSMNLNTSVNIYYNGLTASDTLDPLTQVYLSSDRFVKDDKDTIMNCQEVLSSVLNLFNANICQVGGEWYVYRPNELYGNTLVNFRRYSKDDNSYINLNTKNLSFNLGSHVNNKYPHHAGGGQQIEIKGGITKSRINYKYGFLKGLMPNKNLIRTSNYVWNSYTINTANQSQIYNDPNDFYGFKMKPTSSSYQLLMTADPIALLINNKFDFKISLTNTNDTLTEFNFSINIGSYWLTASGDWVNSGSIQYLAYQCTLGTNFYILSSKPLPTGGDLIVKIYNVQTSSFNKIYEINSLDVVNTTTSDNGIIGEFHTAQRQNRPSSIATDTSTIYNGDNIGLIYDGAIYKADQTTRTFNWFRNNKNESKPLLEIAVEDSLRLQQNPMKIFSGQVYGYLPYLSVVDIDSISGVFLPIEWDFDSRSNITNIRLLEFFGLELNDIDYSLTYDYGNTVKPTITS